MAKIQFLSEATIDKIAAGEVIERPASIVKELVENAIDAGAESVTVEIKDGGISFIRVTDDGHGIERDQVRNAFCRHATSKLQDAEDLDKIMTLGFRGEALSSIAAISQVELISKTKNDLTGVRYCIEGAKETEFSEVGVPSGTTIIVRNIFFNTPVRKKFLKTAATEGGYINELCEHLALSKPNVSFRFVNNGQVKFHTSGDGDLKELVYRIYGKDMAKEVIPVSQSSKGISVNGLLGKPVINRANRNFENYFVNGRYIKSSLISKAVEEGYGTYLMQHKFPFFILDIQVDPETVDVNVHPTKMEVRFTNGELLYDFLVSMVSANLKIHDMIPQIELVKEETEKKVITKKESPEIFETNRSNTVVSTTVEEEVVSLLNEENEEYNFEEKTKTELVNDNMPLLRAILGKTETNKTVKTDNVIKANKTVIVEKPVQMGLFEEGFLNNKEKASYEVLGQLFATYWLIAYEDKLLIMDQHAAHEKIKYERLLKNISETKLDTQNLEPPVIVSVSGREQAVIEQFTDTFARLGFTLEEFGGNEYAIRTMPLDLFGSNAKDMFDEILSMLSEDTPKGTPDFILEKIASMACKAAVKGNHSMRKEEVLTLIHDLMELDNPYSCPHGRPTIISMSKYEIEKKFKRIV